MKFRERPSEVDAIQFTGDNLDSIRKLASSHSAYIGADGVAVIDTPFTLGGVCYMRKGYGMVLSPGNRDGTHKIQVFTDEKFQERYETAT